MPEGKSGLPRTEVSPRQEVDRVIISILGELRTGGFHENKQTITFKVSVGSTAVVASENLTDAQEKALEKINSLISELYGLFNNNEEALKLKTPILLKSSFGSSLEQEGYKVEIDSTLK